MYGQVHANYVFYRERPEPGHRYRQIVVVELDKIQVRICEGDVIRADKDFLVDNPDAEYYIGGDLRAALADAQREADQGVADGWTQYRGF